ncbi:neurotactin [Agrilus planipennis]|uniref:Neurotactin n=1 Tax=Agrilus planipennis TaxID=224129 RepID=A0A1W4WEL0_AGRPL|nr:neurotactin [Agrilus planipennis]
MSEIDEKSKSDDKKVIEMEEKEKMLNEENKAHDVIAEVEQSVGKDGEKETSKIIKTEGREVQPKKIPIGGIQMPGFFTRSKSKEKCKDGDAEIEGTELLDSKEKESKDEQIQPTRIKLPNPFRKSKALSEEDVSGGSEPKEKKRLLQSIRLPLVSVCPRKKRDEQKLESRSGKAGLASVETLDDTEKKEEELKSIPLDDKKNLEKQENDQTWRQKLKAYRIVISALLVFILLVIIIVAFAIPGKSRLTSVIRNGKYVQTITSCGKVEGLLDDGAVAFRGIPYARPPLNDLRFKPAQPLNDLAYCWNFTEPFQAYNSTNTCFQLYSNGTAVGEEDCLTLDVVTPDVRYDTPLPVIVLIGAETLMGGSPGKMRPSARFARSKDVVYVRPNFRLGALGFLAANVLTKSVHPPTSGNYGLSDIVEALKWVQLNIEHFGGDKNSVTLFGHRAGATLVTALATTKDAKLLFKQAWASSGSTIFPTKTLSESERGSSSYLEAISCDSVNCLREKEPEVLTNNIEDLWRKPIFDLPTPTEDPTKRHEWLVMDGNIIRDSPRVLWSREEGIPVQLIIGTTAHAAYSEKLRLKYTDWTEELVKKHVNESKIGHSNLTEEVFKLYPPSFRGLVTMISDIRIVCPLFYMTEEMPNTTFYVVSQPRGELDIADVDSDIDAIFGRYEPKTVAQRRYVSSIQQLFYYFITHRKIGLEKTKRVLVVEQDALPQDTYSHCDFWKKHDFVPKYSQLD